VAGVVRERLRVETINLLALSAGTIVGLKMMITARPDLTRNHRGGDTKVVCRPRPVWTASIISVGRTRTSVSRSQPSELTLQRVDLCKIAAGVVVAAKLAASQSEAPACVSVTGAVSAQVDDRREVLLLL
jgi:hypothetical protein